MYDIFTFDLRNLNSVKTFYIHIIGLGIFSLYSLLVMDIQLVLSTLTSKSAFLACLAQICLRQYCFHFCAGLPKIISCLISLLCVCILKKHQHGAIFTLILIFVTATEWLSHYNSQSALLTIILVYCHDKICISWVVLPLQKKGLLLFEKLSYWCGIKLMTITTFGVSSVL